MNKHTYHVVSCKNTLLLETKMNEYEVSALGSLAISNGQCFQSFLGIPRLIEVPLPTEEVKVEEEKKEDTPAPIKKKKRKSRAKPKPKTTD